MSRTGILFLAAFSAGAILAQPPKKEEPVGLVLLPGGAKLIRAGVETPLAAKPGDILFSGDAMKTEAAPASFLYCPTKTSQSLAPAGDILFGPAQLKVRAGKVVDPKPLASCFLPQVVRVAVASQQHYGVSMTRGLKDGSEPKLTPPDQWPAAAAAEAAVFSKALAADPDDAGALVGRAAVFENHKLLANALADYQKVGNQWKDAVWIKGKIFELSESLADATAAAAAATPAGGKTYALLIGVSKYQRLPKDQWLQFAEADATLFEKHVLSPRGGSLPPENVLRLTDEKATTAALRNAFQTFLKGRATKKDTVLILIAGHGTVESPGSKKAFILTSDSDPQDLAGTAMPMGEVQTLIDSELSKVGRVAVFVDVCRAGNIGSIKNTTVNAVVEKLGEAEGEILGLMASRPKELSYEGPEFGGGHGAFSYFLLKGLEGAADKNKDGKVDVNELINYVQTEVAKGTNDKQHPREFGSMDNAVALADTTKPGIDLAHAHFPMIFDSGGEPAYLAAAQVAPSTLTPIIGRFNEALARGRLLPDVPNSAFAALSELKNKLEPEQYAIQENRLRVALEDQGQQVILRYLTGDQVPQTQKEFQAGEQYYKAARQLTPESLFLEGRQSFLRGRSLLFDKNYAQAADLLESAVRIDPGGSHAYNALGIAYLEQADFARAIPAFRDAVRRAPHWTYPLHNLALCYIETGDSAAAIRTYKQAIRLTPQYSYLPYNLGLVYQRLNRRKDAEAAYRSAMTLSPESAEPYNALGSLKASTGKAKEAEQLYKQALQNNPAMLAARHNLALLLAAQKQRLPEALGLWRENLTRAPDYLPSRLSLAEALPDPKEAIAEYRVVLKDRPEYLAARLALADLMQKTGDSGSALAELQEGLKTQKSSAIYERIGDIEAGQNHASEARAAYQSALENAPDANAVKRLRKKIK
ncbi:MAG TPA: tetratricopeptide repeat protein [Bryobacteraceae bacterium]|jgi:tetratricopeptide (TPR) repeat protein|nr:tetratricopeptide repeat protein [Bryobacteraceae bacterium]